MNWISVHDKLPPEKSLVLVYDDCADDLGKFYVVCVTSYLRECFAGIEFDEWYRGITHWTEIDKPE
jgi:hypothetical protein